MVEIIVSDLVIEIDRKNIKNLHLSVNPPDGKVRVAAPNHINDEAVRLFIVSKLTWIHKQQRKFENQPRQSEREFVSGESHYFNGERYLLNVISRKGNSKVVIRNKTHIDLYVREKSSRESRERVLTEWYRKQLKAKVPDMVKKWQETIGVEVDSWGVRKMKTRWGSCDMEKKQIWINLELAKKPERCLEYIIVHELVHLLERKHDDRFVELMDDFMPNWRLYRDELNQYPLKHEQWGY